MIECFNVESQHILILKYDVFLRISVLRISKIMRNTTRNRKRRRAFIYAGFGVLRMLQVDA